MSDLAFNCPHCQQALEAPEDMDGETIECPSCQGSIQLPDPSPDVSMPQQPRVRSRAFKYVLIGSVSAVVILAVALGFLFLRKPSVEKRISSLDDTRLLSLVNEYPADSEKSAIIRKEIERRKLPLPPPEKNALVTKDTKEHHGPKTKPTVNAPSSHSAQSQTAKDNDPEQGPNILTLRYGSMVKPKDYDVSASSFAFRTSERTVILILRNFDSPSRRVYATPPDGHATLFIALSEGNLANNADHRITEVANGTYRPGLFKSGTGHSPGGLRVITGTEGDGLFIFICGTWWILPGEDGIQEPLWFAKEGLVASQQRQKLRDIGTASITEISEGDTGFLAGRVDLGGDAYLGLARGSFRVPLIEQPNDFPP